MNTLSKLLSFLFTMGLSFSVPAQNSNAALIQVISGQVFENNNQKFGGIYGADAGYISRLENSAKDWTRILNAKEMVWTFHWRNMNSLKNATDSIQDFGNVFGLSVSADFKLFDAGSAVFYFTPTIGLSYFTQTSIIQYEEKVGVGSRINDLVSAGINAVVPFNHKLSMVAGLNFMHFSNAGFQNPNGGINSVSLKLGIESQFKQGRHDTGYNHFPPAFRHPEGLSFELAAGIGRRGVDYSHKGFFRSAWYGGTNYLFNQVIGLKAGFDAVYSHTVFDSSQYAATFQDYGSSYDHVRTGISIGAELALNKLVITYQLGKYLHFNSPYSLKRYWKGGFRYYFTPAIGIQSIVYLHGFNADFINWGLVWRIK